MLPKIGDSATLTRIITLEDIEQFALLVGDTNPVHMHEQFASKTRFGARIAHGMWGASLLSALIGTRLPGPGAIYLNQTLKFKAPIYPGDTVTARVTVKGLREDKKIITLETVCLNQNGETLIEGEAVTLLEEVESFG
jgi:acyl dehydratase